MYGRRHRGDVRDRRDQPPGRSVAAHDPLLRGDRAPAQRPPDRERQACLHRPRRPPPEVHQPPEGPRPLPRGDGRTRKNLPEPAPKPGDPPEASRNPRRARRADRRTRRPARDAEERDPGIPAAPAEQGSARRNPGRTGNERKGDAHMKEVVITGAARTAIGSLMGGLSDLLAPRLGAVVIAV